ncbi:MAG: homoserine kinase [Longimicrobiales bacterium]|nr:homoserine kinase [Longimicrobiales bacterium]
MTDLVPARVRVPCSTSNLGSGYDTIGLALNRYLEAAFEPDRSGRLRLHRSGTLTSLEESDERDLVADAFLRGLAASDVEPSGTLHLESEVPVARGLGTSAAARIAGFDLALAARGAGGDDEAALRFAWKGEGHADNVAPCLLGGLRAVAPGDDGPVVMELPLSEKVGFAYAAPASRVSTEEARALLPERVAHRVAAASLGRVVALVRGLAQGDPELVRIGVKDELHVPHRLPLVPGADAAIVAGEEVGAWAVTISGAGSGLIALCAPEDAERVAAAMRRAFQTGTGEPEAVGLALEPDFEGLRRLPP